MAVQRLLHEAHRCYTLFLLSFTILLLTYIAFISIFVPLNFIHIQINNQLIKQTINYSRYTFQHIVQQLEGAPVKSLRSALDISKFKFVSCF